MTLPDFLSGFDAVGAVLLIPLVSIFVLAALPGYRLTALLNVLASLLTLIAAITLTRALRR